MRILEAPCGVILLRHTVHIAQRFPGNAATDEGYTTPAARTAY